MYFHAGQDFVLNTRDVIGVFDLDTAGPPAGQKNISEVPRITVPWWICVPPAACQKASSSPISPMRPFTSANFRP